MNMKKKQPIPENLQKMLDELREKRRKQRAEFIRKFHEGAEYSAEVDRQRQRDRRILIPWHYSNEFLTRFIVLCPHEINIAPYATYKGGGRKYTIELEKSGKVVRAKKFLSKGEVDPDMCKEIRDILSGYEEFDMGRAYAIVSNMCLDHVDEDTAIYTFAPEPMKKTIKFEDEEDGEARLRLVGSEKYPIRAYVYPSSKKDGGGDILHLGAIEIRIPVDPPERRRRREKASALSEVIADVLFPRSVV